MWKRQVDNKSCMYWGISLVFAISDTMGHFRNYGLSLAQVDQDAIYSVYDIYDYNRYFIFFLQQKERRG